MRNRSNVSRDELQRRRVLSTREAAELLARSPATLRKWASRNLGPIQPVRICGRLGWRAQDLAELLRNAR
jgi:predicted DNA-binding transcriptional regulator AlpA